MKLFDSWHFTKTNYILFGAGVGFIVLGYILMSLGETTGVLATKISPIVLIAGYCVLIPISILKDFKD